MRHLATLQLCCACLAAFWAADVQSVGEHSVSLPYFTEEPTDLSDARSLLRLGSSNVYYFNSLLKTNVQLLPLRCLATTPDAANKNFIKYFWTLNGAEIPQWRDKTTVVMNAEDFQTHLSKYRCVASLLDTTTGKTRNISSSQLTLIPGPHYPTPTNDPYSEPVNCMTNSLLTLNSSCFASPVPYIHWNNVDSLVQSGAAYTSHTGSLVINCNGLTSHLLVTVNCDNAILRFIAGDQYNVQPFLNDLTKRPSQHFQYNQELLTYTVGDSVNFACRSAITMPNPQVKFFKRYPQQAVEIGVNRPYLTFIQMNVTLETAGQYYCEVTTNESSATLHEEMELKVLAPPYWIRKPPAVVYVIAGNSLSLEYEVGGSPIPDKLDYRLRDHLTDNSTGSADSEFTTRSYRDTRVHRLGDSYALELSFANNQGELVTSVAVIVIKPINKPILRVTRFFEKTSGENLLTVQCSSEFDALIERPEVKWEFPYASFSAHEWYSSSTAPIAITNGVLKSHRSITLGGNELSTLDELLEENLYIFGNYTCTIFSAIYGNVSTTYLVDRSAFAEPAPAEVGVVNRGNFLWTAAIGALLAVIVLAFAIVIWRNMRGHSYNVDEEERQRGNDPLAESRREGFAEYRRPDQDPQPIPSDSVVADILNQSLDGTELDSYSNDIYNFNFNEDCTYIRFHSPNQSAATAQPRTVTAPEAIFPNTQLNLFNSNSSIVS